MMTNRQGRSSFKNKFTAAEDFLLIELIEKRGFRDWSEIASKFGCRNARQCRERWNNYVNPAILNGPWTDEEERILDERYRQYPAKWQTIATFFPNRSKNSIKNHWIRQQKKKIRYHASVEEQKKDPALDTIFAMEGFGELDELFPMEGR
jgi:hypothetical protein